MSSKQIVIALTAVATTTAVIGVLAIIAMLNTGHGEVPMSTPRTAAAPSATPGMTSSGTPATGTAMADIDGVPHHITILHEGEILADAEMTPITLNGDGVLAPPQGRAGFYHSPTDWSTLPGDLDTYRGIIAGHDVTGTGAKDVFYNLGDVRQGDRILLTYQLDDGGTSTAEFEATADAKSAPKSDVVQAEEYRYLWRPATRPGRLLSIFSCDLDKADPGQHSRNNWIVDAVRIR